MDKTAYTRKFASFSGKCPYGCLHCYTFNPNYNNAGKESIEEIVNQLDGTNPSVIYISGHKENFINPNDGLELCEALFNKYHSDLLITTRNIFNQQELSRLSLLNRKMQEENKDLFFCISIPALDSYKKLESNPNIPSPQQRMDFLKQVYDKGIYTFLTIKPLCPNKFIPIEEALEIIKECKNHSTLVISSGIVVDKYILKRLKNFPTDYKFNQDQLMECLDNDISVQYVDVEDELNQIERLCSNNDIPFYQHSMPAIQYVKTLRKNKR